MSISIFCPLWWSALCRLELSTICLFISSSLYAKLAPSGDATGVWCAVCVAWVYEDWLSCVGFDFERVPTFLMFYLIKLTGRGLCSLEIFSYCFRLISPSFNRCILFDICFFHSARPLGPPRFRLAATVLSVFYSSNAFSIADLRSSSYW